MSEPKTVYLTRRIEISSAHSYSLDTLTEEERIATFGKSAATHAHGHNYDVRVTVKGNVDDETGMVVNIKSIDALMKERIDEQLDHRHYSLEVDKLKNVWPTLETLGPFVWNEMQPHLEGCELHEVQVFENEDFYVNYQGGNMVYLTRVYRFAAAHRLHNPQLSDEENRELFGKCNNLHGHGHNYTLEITLCGEPDPRTNCLVDIGAMDAAIEERIMKPFDHVHLNLDTEEFRGINPSSENIVKVFWGLLEDAFPPADLHRIRLWETSKSYFDYYGEKDAVALG
ncbi:MAG: 6-carboxytetrahydropterin synthase [Candidatus Omnitrophica bacterium]|nr:6-carboxytetrahydropterin synthase [Candidatus Omnitrophota bacterium]